MVVKIAPDLDVAHQSIAALLMKHQIDGVTNTTISRVGIEHLSTHRKRRIGAPLTQRATAVIQQLHHLPQGAMPIIASVALCPRRMHKRNACRRQLDTVIYRFDLSWS
jgi:dihydroorotate dehydrogenase